jgi:hypothetical protein
VATRAAGSEANATAPVGKVTVPKWESPDVTVAANVTGWPGMDGFDRTSVVPYHQV